MKEIICDTNIWYGLGNGTIIKPKDSVLIATWNNIVEIGFSHPKVKKLTDMEEVKRAAKAIIDNADKIIENDPFTYSANKFDSNIKLQTNPLKFILENIVKDGLPDNTTYYEKNSVYQMFLKIKEEFAKDINSEKSTIRNRVFSNNIIKEKFKVTDNLQRNEQAYSHLLDIHNFLDKEHQLIITFENEDDFVNTINIIKKDFELFIYTKQKFLQKWILDKNMKIVNNDFFDLLNLVYVENGQYYWTKENRWKTSINEAKMTEYLWK